MTASSTDRCTGTIRSPYTIEIVKFKAFQGFSRLFHGKIQGYFSDKNPPKK